jgi:signal transduction histidine kinase
MTATPLYVDELAPGAPDPLPRNPVVALVSPYTWLAVIHVVTSFMLCVPIFVFGVLFLVLPWPLFAALVVPGFVALFVLVTIIRVIGSVERARFRSMLGVQLAAPVLPRWEGRPLRYVAATVSAPGLWRLVAYCIVRLPLGIFSFTVMTVVWCGPVSLIALPSVLHVYPHHRASLWFFHVTDYVSASLVSAAGVGLLLVLVGPAMRAITVVEAAVARSLLGRSVEEELRERVGQLETTRQRVVDSAEDERKRIERDLHDGAQQRLVALAMALGRAKAKMPTDTQDPEALAVRALIDEAHGEAKQAITELRDLTRGLHPPVLTDRGLDAALSALAARSPVPTSVQVDLPVRPPATLEAIAYFVVAEALTNVAKHAQAQRISVSVRALSDALRVTITDDGKGGADPRHGSGLTGLADRVAGVDGRLTVDSPAGGPTLLCADLPWRR